LRFLTLLLFVVSFAAWVALPACAQTGGDQPQSETIEQLRRELAAAKADLADVHAKLEELQRLIADLQNQYAAQIEALEQRIEGEAPIEAPEEDLEALRRAAEAEAAVTAPEEEPEEVAFRSGALSLQALNPEISAVGELIWTANDPDGASARSDFNLRTFGVHLESYLDPYSRFKAALPFTENGAELGEAYFERYGLRKDLNLTLGKFRQQFGVVNRWHKHGLDQVDFPLALRQIFGPGGLNQTGLALDWNLPAAANSAQQLTLQVTDAQNPRLFGGNTRSSSSHSAAGIIINVALTSRQVNIHLFRISSAQQRHGLRSGSRCREATEPVTVHVPVGSSLGLQPSSHLSRSQTCNPRRPRR